MSKATEIIQHVMGKLESESPFFVIAGAEYQKSAEQMYDVAEELKSITDHYNLPLVFHASFDFDIDENDELSYTRQLETGLNTLLKIKEEFDIPISFEIQSLDFLEEICQVADIIQVSADFRRFFKAFRLITEQETIVLFKRGESSSNEMMIDAIKQMRNMDNLRYIIQERSNKEGYSNLTVDSGALALIRLAYIPTVFNVTYGIHKRSINYATNIPQQKFSSPMARAALSFKTKGLFVGIKSKNSARDNRNAIDMTQFQDLISDCVQLCEVLKKRKPNKE